MEVNEIKEEETKTPNEVTDEELFAAIGIENPTADTLTASQETSGNKIETESQPEKTSDEGEQEEKQELTETTQPEPVQAEEPKMLTQEKVNELVGNARKEGRNSAMKEFLAKYGVEKEEELDNLFGKGQSFDDLNDEYSAQGNSIKQVMAENALLKTHIDETRWDDVKLILGGKGLEVTAENIEQEILTHPEWRSSGTVGNKVFTPEMGKQAQNTPKQEPQKVSDFRVLGGEGDSKVTEEIDLDKLFNFNR